MARATSIVIRFSLGCADGAAYGNKSWARSGEASSGRSIMNLKEKLSSVSKEKKQLSPKQQKVVSVLNWVATAVCIVVIIFALVVAIFTIASTTNDDKVTRFGNTYYLNVATDSMSPTFSPNDVILAKAVDEGATRSLQVGQVVTFRTKKSTPNGLISILNTHRIVKINVNSEGVVTSYVTRGDNQTSSWQDAVIELAKAEEERNTDVIGKTENVQVSEVVATWGTVNADGTFSAGKMLKGVGGFANWIQDTENFGASQKVQKVRFFCVVVLPLILLFVIYAFVLIRTIVIAKLENQRKVQAQQVVTVDSLSDEEKRRLAQEYLASLQQSAASDSANTAEEAPAEAPSEDASSPENPQGEEENTQQ